MYKCCMPATRNGHCRLVTSCYWGRIFAGCFRSWLRWCCPAWILPSGAYLDTLCKPIRSAAVSVYTGSWCRACDPIGAGEPSNTETSTRKSRFLQRDGVLLGVLLDRAYGFDAAAAPEVAEIAYSFSSYLPCALPSCPRNGTFVENEHFQRRSDAPLIVHRVAGFSRFIAQD